MLLVTKRCSGDNGGERECRESKHESVNRGGRGACGGGKSSTFKPNKSRTYKFVEKKVKGGMEL